MGAIFRKFEKYIDVLTPGSLVLEIGTDRGLKREEYQGSTKYIKELSDASLCRFITVDVDDELLEPARQRGVDAWCMTGEEFCGKHLAGYGRPIAMAYLDNFDWDWDPPKAEPFIKVQQELYKTKYNMVMNNVASQRAHVVQTMLMIPHLAEHCVVGFDDTFYMPHLGHYTGKGAAAVPLLLGLGFEIVEEEEEDPIYGIILKR